MAVAVDFHMVPDPIVYAKAIGKAAVELEDLSLPLALSQQAAADAIKRNFERETDPEGHPWAPWSPNTRRDSGKILHLTGALEAAATSRGPYHVTHNELFYEGGSLPEYWAVHQFGHERARHSAADVASLQAAGFEDFPISTPARPYIGLDVEGQDQVYEIFDRWVGGTLDIGIFGSGPRAGQAFIRGAGGRFGKL